MAGRISDALADVLGRRRIPEQDERWKFPAVSCVMDAVREVFGEKRPKNYLLATHLALQLRGASSSEDLMRVAQAVKDSKGELCEEGIGVLKEEFRVAKARLAQTEKEAG